MAKKNITIEKLVPDTSIIIEGILSKKIEAKEITPKEIYIHEAVISELEHQANENKTIGYLGLDEIEKLREMTTPKFDMKFTGKKPSMVDIKYAKLGDIDSNIRDLAWEIEGTLMTADKVQAKVAKGKGIDLIFIKLEAKKKELMIEKYFDDTTMSIHLREGTIPVAKRGIPGEWEMAEVGKSPLTQKEVIDMARELNEEASSRHDSFIEIQRTGSTIIQLARFRIVITNPPFSDGWEITAVRPVAILKLEDYNLSEKLTKRIEKDAEGILIAGSPGMGKSTFAQALASFYASLNKTVKTVEAPRDLVLPDTVTQYAISHSSAEEVHDVLLLTRPDYTVFDEMRNTKDFELFADMRLAGVGMVGIVHATNAVDSIQRFIGRIELGVIPQIIDTVVFIKFGKPEKVLNLSMTVKCPTGMTEEDLARPIVEIKDFETGKLEYEIYSFGEHTVVMPLDKVQQKGGDQPKPVHHLAQKQIEEEIANYTQNFKIEIISDTKCKVFVPEREIPRLIGKQGKNIEHIEKELGIRIDVEELRDFNPRSKQQEQPLNNRQQSNNQQEQQQINKNGTIDYQVSITKKTVEFHLGSKLKNKEVDIAINDDYVLSAKVGSAGTLKIHKKNKFGQMLEEAFRKKKDITLSLVG